MQKEFNDWKQDGRVFIWRFLDCSKSYQGWHIAIDCNGAHAIKKLFQILSSFEFETYRTVNIYQPTEKIVSMPGCNSKVEKISKFKIFYFFDDVEKYQLTFDNEVLSLELGSFSLAKISLGFDRIIKGETDFYINPSAYQKRNTDGFWFWKLNN